MSVIARNSYAWAGDRIEVFTAAFDAAFLHTLVDNNNDPPRFIRLLSFAGVTTGATTVTFLSSVAGPAISGPFSTNNSALLLPFNPAGWCQTLTKGHDLVLLVATETETMSGMFSYALVE